MKNDIDKLLPIWKPHEGQRAFLESRAKYKVLACGRRWGKTDACAASILLGLMQSEPIRSLIVAPTLDQSRLLFERVLEMLGRAAHMGLVQNEAIRVRNSPYPSLTYGPHTLKARSGHLSRALRGNEATRIVVDEAAFVPEEVIAEVVMPMLATTDGNLTLISTPCGRNHFYRFFEMGRRGENGFWSRSDPSSESPWVRREFLEVQRQLISERAYMTEYEAQFMDSAGRVFRTEDIEKCLVPSLTSSPGPPFCIGVDWARYTDFTAVAVLSGNRNQAALVETDRFNRMSWSSQIERVARIVAKYPEASLTCDATGGGDLATEALRQRLPHTAIEGFVFTPSSKAGLIDGLAWLVERGSLKMTPNPVLQRELEHFESRVGPSGGTRLESQSGYHDDMVMALALAARQLPADYRPTIALGAERTFDFAENRTHP